MLSDRMLRAARLDVDLYEEVERDTNANLQALWVVLIVAVASGIGAGIGRGPGPGGFGSGFIGGVLGSVVGWIVYSLVTYWIGTAIFKGTATPGELLRTIGFAQVPGVLRLFSFIPILGGLLNLVVLIWLLVAGVIAVRQALDFDTGKAVATVVLGWLAMVIVLAVLAVFGLGMAFLAR